MSPLARVVDEHVGELAVAAVAGEVDASNARDLGERLRAALTNRSLALIVDLAETTYLDSAGITLLFALDAELRERRQRLHLVVPAGVADRARARDHGPRRRRARPRDASRPRSSRRRPDDG